MSRSGKLRVSLVCAFGSWLACALAMVSAAWRWHPALGVLFAAVYVGITVSMGRDLLDLDRDAAMTRLMRREIRSALRRGDNRISAEAERAVADTILDGPT